MSSIHHSCNCLVLRTPPRASVRWPHILHVIAGIFDALQEAAEMRRTHRRYPFNEE
jgi:hypothetical protein